MSRFVIPTNSNNAKAEADLIIKTQALNIIQREFFSSNIPNANKKDDPKIKTKSYLGSQVFSNLSLYVNNVRVDIDTVLFSVSQRKNIITTPIQGRNGTVKEYISMGDYQINIKGVISGKYGNFPSQQNSTNGVYALENLKTICEINVPIDVFSWYLNYFNIYNVVILDYKFEQKEGEYSLVPFEINAISDTPYEINLSK